MTRRVASAVLLAGLITSLTMPAAQAPVTLVTVTTDRSDYVRSMSVTATALIDFSPPFSSVDEDALVEWSNETGAVLWSGNVSKTRTGGQTAEVVATWTPPSAGLFRVNVSTNQTDGTPPRIWGTADFRVWNATDYVIAQDILVAMDRPWYEVGALATATANVTDYVGNPALLDTVQFNWYYPSGAPARLFANVSVAGGLAVDAWTPDVIGVGYRVNVTYLGNDTAWNETTFDVSQATTPAPSVNPGQTVTLTLAQSPWRVCGGDLVVAATGTLVIEAGVIIRFCRDAHLIVRGTLTGDGTLAAPILLTSYEIPEMPGDWGGVRFEGATGSRLSYATVEYVTDAIAAIDSSPLLVSLQVRRGIDQAVNLTNSVSEVRDSQITGGFGCGLCLWGATPLVRNVTIAGIPGDGIRIGGGSAIVRDTAVSNVGGSGVSVAGGAALLENLTLSGNNRGLYVFQSTGVRVDRAQITGGNISVRAVEEPALAMNGVSLSGAAFRALDLTTSTATLANSTVASGSSADDFMLIASTAVLLNSTFVDNATKRLILNPSRLIVQNFLAVDVTVNGTALADASVAVTVDGVPLAGRTTGPNGRADWIVVEDRFYNQTAMTKRTVRVTISRNSYAVQDSPRTVDMATSHTEFFLATYVPPGNGDGGGGFPLLLLAAVIAAAVLLSLGFVFLRRRREKEEPEAEAPPAGETAPAPAAETPPAPKPPRLPVQGTCYAVHGEKSDAAIRWFADAVQRGGAPGLCITRLHPGAARARFRLENIPLFWLSRTLGNEALNPTNLGAIVDLVRAQTADQPGTYVLLDGLEYLYTQNDFSKVAKFVQALTDVVAEHKAILIVPMDPRSFDPEQLAIISRDLTAWA